MKSKSKKFVMLTLVLSVVLTGCAMARGFYADEISSEDFDVGQGVLLEGESVPVEEYREWIEEKLEEGIIVDLTGSDGVPAYGTEGSSVVTDPDELEMVNSWDWGIE